jgi:hypothetical protein
METSRTLIEIGASAIEAMAVLLIEGAFLWASIRFLMHIGRHASNPIRDIGFFWVKRCRWGWSFSLQQM